MITYVIITSCQVVKYERRSLVICTEADVNHVVRTTLAVGKCSLVLYRLSW